MRRPQPRQEDNNWLDRMFTATGGGPVDKKAEKARQRTVDAIVNLINPRPEQKEECRNDVIGNLALWDMSGELGRSHSPEEALKPKARKTMLRPVHAWAAKGLTFLKSLPGGDTKARIAAISRELEDLVEHVDGLLNEPAGKPRRTSTKQQWAAKTAFALLLEYRPDRITTKATKRIAVLLFGDKKADLTRYCQSEVRRWKKPGRK